MEALSDYELWQWAIDNDLSIDMGNVAGGKFVDDGFVRIYDADTLTVLAVGYDLRSTLEDYELKQGY